MLGWSGVGSWARPNARGLPQHSGQPRCRYRLTDAASVAQVRPHVGQVATHRPTRWGLPVWVMSGRGRGAPSVRPAGRCPTRPAVVCPPPPDQPNRAGRSDGAGRSRPTPPAPAIGCRTLPAAESGSAAGVRQDVDGESSSRRIGEVFEANAGRRMGSEGVFGLPAPLRAPVPGERDRRDFFRRPIPDGTISTMGGRRSSVTKLSPESNGGHRHGVVPGRAQGSASREHCRLASLGKVLSEAIGHGGRAMSTAHRKRRLRSVASSSRRTAEGADRQGVETPGEGAGMAGGPLGVAGGLPASFPGGRPANAKPQISLARTSRPSPPGERPALVRRDRGRTRQRIVRPPDKSPIRTNAARTVARRAALFSVYAGPARGGERRTAQVAFVAPSRC